MSAYKLKVQTIDTGRVVGNLGFGGAGDRFSWRRESGSGSENNRKLIFVYLSIVTVL